MEGNPEIPASRGIIPSSFQHVFDKIGIEGSQNKRYLVRASFLEIYNENLRDLLSTEVSKKLELREDPNGSVYVKNLSVQVVRCFDDVMNLLKIGKKRRQTASTEMNATSSRSHSIFTIIVETSEATLNGKPRIKMGKLNLVDLAGSERQCKTGATGQRLKEATKINFSLSALGNVISSLIDNKVKHIPYRDSKLTRLLQDSLGGNTKTVMIANCGPADYNFDETLSTLRYANRAKNIRNTPKINEDTKDTMLKQYQTEIEELKQKLATTGVKEVCEIPIKSTHDKHMEKKFLKLKQKHKVSELERLKLVEQVKVENRYMAQANETKVVLQQKLRQLEEKLLVGGILMDKAARQEQDLRKAEAQIEERKIRQRELARKVIEQEEEKLVLDEKYLSLQDEVEAKTKKLKKLWNKFQTAKSEINQLNAEFQKERESLMDNIRELKVEMNLDKSILNSFIPKWFYEEVQQRLFYDEKSTTFKIQNSHLCARHQKHNKRFEPNNFDLPLEDKLQFELEIPLTYAKTESFNDKDSALKFSGSSVICTEISKPFKSLNVKCKAKYSVRERQKRKPRSHQANKKSQEGLNESFPTARGIITRAST